MAILPILTNGFWVKNSRGGIYNAVEAEWGPGPGPPLRACHAAALTRTKITHNCRVSTKDDAWQLLTALSNIYDLLMNAARCCRNRLWKIVNYSTTLLLTIKQPPKRRQTASKILGVHSRHFERSVTPGSLDI